MNAAAWHAAHAAKRIARSRMELVLFGITALISIACALAMITSRNAVHSALFLVLNFTAVAVLYLLLQAPFLAMIQITV